MQHLDRVLFPSNSYQTRTSLSILLAIFVVAAGGHSAFAQPGTPKGKTVKAKPKQPPQKQVEMEEQDPNRLPPGYHPSPAPLAIMSLEQPIATKDELAKLKRDVGKFAGALRNGDLSPGGKQIIESGIRYKLAEMTLPEKRSDLPDLHKTLMQNVTSGVGNPQMKPTEVASMYQYVNQEIVKQIPELLVNNFYVRLHAVLILSELDYAPAYTLLLQVLQAKDIKDDPVQGQPDAIKIAAANGLTRILKFAVPAPPVSQRTVIAHAIVDELKKTDTHWWYQLRLIEALRNMTVSIDAGNNNPFVIDGLLAVISDGKREWTVRAKACYAIGRVPVPAAAKPDDIVTAIANFALQLSTAAQEKPNNPIWKGCFIDVYLAFKSTGVKDKDGKEKDMDAEQRVPGGLLARFKPATQPAYDRIVPIVRDVLNNKAPAAADVKNLGDFVRTRLPNKPAANPDPAQNPGKDDSKQVAEPQSGR